MSPMMIMILLLMASRVLRGGMGDPVDWIVSKLIMMPAILIGLSLHEFGHAFVSDKLGDPTPKSQGRVTVNPLSHIDPMGLICLIVAGFGWGVPVQVNPSYYKNRRRDEALTAVAGVSMNLLIALISIIVTKLIISFAPNAFLYSTVGGVVVEVLQYMIYINFILMVFNLLPIPPLDGFNIATQIFNLQQYDWYYKIYNMGGLILLAVILLGGTSFVLGPIVSTLYNLALKFIMM